MPRLCGSKKERSHYRTISQSRDDEKINKMRTEIEELRAEIKANNLSLKKELHEIKQKLLKKQLPLMNQNCQKNHRIKSL